MRRIPPILTEISRQLNRASGWIESGRSALYGLFFPWPCPGCSGILSYPQSLCEPCAEALPRIGSPFCARCGAPMPEFWRVTTCPDCRLQRSPLTEVRSCFLYEGLVRQMIRTAKYRRTARPLRYFAESMYLLARSEFPQRIHAVVPVPLHRAREWERTFNQSMLIARHISQWWGLPLWTHIHRSRRTPPQSGLSGAARRRNLRDAFRVAPGRIVPRSVLLVDDVVTTGATLEACAATLRRAGARRVYAITVARAVKLKR